MMDIEIFRNIYTDIITSYKGMDIIYTDTDSFVVKIGSTLESRHIHTLKCTPDYFNAISNDKKRFEIRKNDRNFRLYDFCILSEFNGSYTGKHIAIQIIYFLPEFQGLKPGYCAFSFKIKRWYTSE